MRPTSIKVGKRAEKCWGCDYVHAWNTTGQCCGFYLQTGQRRQEVDGKCLSKTSTTKKAGYAFDVPLPQR